MKRLSFKRPGYDCIRAVCQHTPKGDHGISGGDYWWSVVTDEGDIALVLHLHADDWPETIPADIREQMWRSRRGDRPLGSLDLHTAFPPARDALLSQPAGLCEYLKVPCHNGGSWCLATERFIDVLAYDDVGRLLFEQPEAFWVRLEEEAQKRIPAIRERGAEVARWVLCPTCHGEQTVVNDGTPNPRTALRALAALIEERGGALHLSPGKLVAAKAANVTIRLAEDGGLHVAVERD